MVGLPDGEQNFEDMFIHFDKIHERETHGQTDRHRTAKIKIRISPLRKEVVPHLVRLWRHTTGAVNTMDDHFNSMFRPSHSVYNAADNTCSVKTAVLG